MAAKIRLTALARMRRRQAAQKASRGTQNVQTPPYAKYTLRHSFRQALPPLYGRPGKVK